jgi:hypothetical protein
VILRPVAIMLAVTMALVSAFAFTRERKPQSGVPPLSQLAADPPDLVRPCRAVVSTTPAVDIERAQARLRELARGDPATLRRSVAAFEVLLTCALAKNPADGGILALLAWSAWRLDAPVGRITQLIQDSYRLHPFEANTLAVRQLIIAANWNRLGDDVQAIGRADQSLRFAIDRPIIVVPQVGLLFLEAGTDSDLYHEALDRIARTAPQLLEQFEAIASGRMKVVP